MIIINRALSQIKKREKKEKGQIKKEGPKKEKGEIKKEKAQKMRENREGAMLLSFFHTFASK